MAKAKILFLCTGNSARSIMAEYLIRKKDPVRFESYSAGSHPKSAPNPLAIETLRKIFQTDASDAKSKSWDIYKNESFDFVITVCDNAKETCPIWTGKPIYAHWSSVDPVEAIGTQERQLQIFKEVGLQIARRIDLLLNLPVERLSSLRVEIEKAAKDIGRSA